MIRKGRREPVKRVVGWGFPPQPPLPLERGGGRRDQRDARSPRGFLGYPKGRRHHAREEGKDSCGRRWKEASVGEDRGGRQETVSIDGVEGAKETTGPEDPKIEGRMTFRGNLCNQCSDDDGGGWLFSSPGTTIRVHGTVSAFSRAANVPLTIMHPLLRRQIIRS